MKNANGTARTQISERLTPFGLKLPLNPTTIKSGPKGEILVQKGFDEQWQGDFGGFYVYGGLYGARQVSKNDGTQI